ncbi:MAG TPA: response regulator [Anaeromyxobacteraceae bacterium]|nr:response regulator [Anaeromyxobacteraceae bacterium]
MKARHERTRKALLLENDPVARGALSAALRARGFEVVAAGDGEAGVARLLDLLLDLDLLVSAVDLPGRDGASLLRLVRVSGGERDLRVVLTGRDLRSFDRARLLALGADAVVDLRDGAERAARSAAALAPAGEGSPRPSARDPWLPVPLPAPRFRPPAGPELALAGLA